MKKLNEKELEELMSVIATLQRQIGGAMVIQLLNFGVESSVVHTEIINKAISHRKYLVTTKVEPLTEELKKNILQYANKKTD